MSDAVGRRVRMVAGLLVLAELVVFVLVAQWIGLGWTILATLATSVLGWVLLARQGTKALADLRERARTRRSPGTELGNAGLVAAGGLLMVLPGFISDLIGLLCLLPGTRNLVRGALTRLVVARLPDALRPPVRVDSVRTAEVPGADSFSPTEAPRSGSGSTRMVIEGEIVRGPDGRPLR